MGAVQNSIDEAYPLNYIGVERRGSDRLLGWAHMLMCMRATQQ